MWGFQCIKDNGTLAFSWQKTVEIDLYNARDTRSLRKIVNTVTAIRSYTTLLTILCPQLYMLSMSISGQLLETF